MRITNKQAKVVVGARSAIFAGPPNQCWNNYY